MERESAEIGDAIIALSTAPDHATARSIAHHLVEKRLAACVNIIPNITSVYTWKEVIEENQEWLLVIKSRRGREIPLGEELKQVHPYEVPEFVVLNPSAVEANYLRWIGENTK